MDLTIGGDFSNRSANIFSSIGKTIDGFKTLILAVLGFFKINDISPNISISDISDTFLTLVAISPLLPTHLKISGIAHTRLQETDRVKAMAVELKKLGLKVIEKEDSLEITPNLNKLKEIAENKIQIETYHDHRVAMSFGILGSYDLFGNGKSWLTIQNPSCCEKTFPDFFDRIEALRNNQK